MNALNFFLRSQEVILYHKACFLLGPLSQKGAHPFRPYPGSPFVPRHSEGRVLPLYRGEECISSTGPAILAANHVSCVDPIVIAVSVHRPVYFMAKKELFRFRLFGWLLRQFGAFSVNRHRINLQSFKRATSLLEKISALGIWSGSSS